MRSAIVAIRHYMVLHPAGPAAGWSTIALGLVAAAHLVDIPPVPAFFQGNSSTQANVTLPYQLLFIGGGGLVACIFGLAIRNRAVYAILACAVCFTYLGRSVGCSLPSWAM